MEQVGYKELENRALAAGGLPLSGNANAEVIKEQRITELKRDLAHSKATCEHLRNTTMLWCGTSMGLLAGFVGVVALLLNSC